MNQTVMTTSKVHLQFRGFFILIFYSVNNSTIDCLYTRKTSMVPNYQLFSVQSCLDYQHHSNCHLATPSKPFLKLLCKPIKVKKKEKKKKQNCNLTFLENNNIYI